jgi:hypothetical protein
VKVKLHGTALVLLLAAMCILAGCSTLRLAYDNADTFLHWRASAYVPLTGRASEELEERIDDFLLWHRRHALPQYARLATEAARRTAAGLSPADLVWGYDSFMAQARESVREGAVRIAPMLDRLNAEQVAYLERGFVEDNRRFARENLRGSEKDRLKRRTRRMVDRLEEWVGKLSQAQVERVRQYAERAPMLDELRDRDRKRLQAQLLAIVRAHEAVKRLPAAVDGWERGRDPAYVAALAAAREEGNRMLLDFDRSLSAEQRARGVARLRGFAEDFRALAAAAKPPLASQ